MRLLILGAFVLLGSSTTVNAAAELRLADLVDTRLNSSAAGLAQVEQQHATAWLKRSKRWVAGAPEIQASYRSDDWATSEAAYEAELGLSVPLATFGSRKAARKRSETEQKLAEANSQRRRLTWAGYLRESYWQAREAEAETVAAREQLALRTRWHHSIQRRVEEGDAPANEALLTEREMMLAKLALQETEAGATAARTAWEEISGIPQLPNWSAEEPATSSQTHPDLRVAEIEVTRLQAERAWVKAQASGVPQLGVSWFREAAPAVEQHIDSAMVSLAIPLGTNHFSSAAQARLAVAVENAKWELEQMRRQHRLAQGQARSAYDAAIAQLPVVEAAAAASKKFAESMQRAHALGEAGLVDVALALTQSQQLQRQLRTARLRVAQKAALYNQTVGYIE